MQEDEEALPLADGLRVLQEERSKLTSLKEHTGYEYLLAIAEAQLETRKQSIFLVPLKGINDVLEQEFKKGEISGIFLFSRIVNIRIDELTDLINETLRQLEENRNDRRSESDTDTITDSN